MILQSLHVAKAFGIDQISAKFLEEGAQEIAIHLANTINLSKELATFPFKCKIAKTKPFLKKVIITDTKNYRPISLLPRDIEGNRKINSRSNAEFSSNELALLYIYLSGFRANHSTDTCLSQ